MNTMRVAGVLYGGHVVVTTASIVDRRPGESILEAIHRVQSEARADCRPPDVVLTEQQYRDLSERLAEEAALLRGASTEDQCP